MDEALRDLRILAVDDSPANLVLESILEDIGYTEIVTLSDPTTAVDTCLAYDPDLLLLDLHMPLVSGLDVMAEIRSRQTTHYLPILMLTADASSEAKVSALTTGANDSSRSHSTGWRSSSVSTTSPHPLAVQGTHQPEPAVGREGRRAHQRASCRQDREILERLAMAAEFRDDQTGQHTKRVSRTSALVAASLGFSGPDVEKIRRAAPLHDVGKIGIPTTSC